MSLVTKVRGKVLNYLFNADIFLFPGPFFKCDFCCQLVTDRVAHMKNTHYSPLNGAFTKVSSGYQCRECDYVSDQLTNIRNHVDAKHNDGANKYVCEECKSEYKTLNSMRAHKSRVHVKKRKIQGTALKNVDRNQKQKSRQRFLKSKICFDTSSLFNSYLRSGIARRLFTEPLLF